jgi:ribosomal 30S subunit maturation factor RimM
MKTPFLTAALLGAAILGSSAYAQTDRPTAATGPTATTATSSDQKMMLKDKWRASKLMGLDVYNEANEKLGDINELILSFNACNRSTIWIQTDDRPSAGFPFQHPW